MKYLLSILLVIIYSCSTVQTYKTISKPTNELLTSSIGSSVYQVKKQKDLPNLFGNADIFGGKVNEGYSELFFMGLDEDESIIFRITNISIDTDETTMSRYGADRSYINPSVSTITTYKKREANVTELPPNTVEFLFNPNDKVLKMDDITIEIKEVTSYSISYILY